VEGVALVANVEECSCQEEGSEHCSRKVVRILRGRKRMVSCRVLYR